MTSASEESQTPEPQSETGREPGSQPAPDKPAPDKPAPDKPAPDKPAPDTPGPEAGVAESELVDEGDVAVKPGPEESDDLFTMTTSDDLSGLEVLLSDDFARIAAERDQYLDSLRRLQADFDNFRKRTDRQRAELQDRANETLLSRLLPVLDAFDLAIAHLGLGDAQPTDEATASLVQVGTLLRDILSREGLARIDAVGVPFDPTIHDATAIDESASAEGDGTEEGAEASSQTAPTGPSVAEVWRAGYRLKDRVIRPAMVRVRG
jgi:molecular chaperone GrpE